RGDAQHLEVLDYWRVSQRQVCAAELRRYVRMSYGEALHVKFVDDCHVQGCANRFVVPPIKTGITDHASGHVWSGVVVINRAWRAVERLRKYSLIPVNLSLDALCIRIEEKIGWIAPQAFLRR